MRSLGKRQERRKLMALVMTLVMIVSGSVINTPSAYADNEVAPKVGSINVSIVADGSDFDDASKDGQPGYDTSEHNEIVRINDTVQYKANINCVTEGTGDWDNDKVAYVRLTIKVPTGVDITEASLGEFCEHITAEDNGSEVTYKAYYRCEAASGNVAVFPNEKEVPFTLIVKSKDVTSITPVVTANVIYAAVDNPQFVDDEPKAGDWTETETKDSDFNTPVEVTYREPTYNIEIADVSDSSSTVDDYDFSTAGYNTGLGTVKGRKIDYAVMLQVYNETDLNTSYGKGVVPPESISLKTKLALGSVYRRDGSGSDTAIDKPRLYKSDTSSAIDSYPAGAANKGSWTISETSAGNVEIDISDIPIGAFASGNLGTDHKKYFISLGTISVIAPVTNGGSVLDGVGSIETTGTLSLQDGGTGYVDSDFLTNDNEASNSFWIRQSGGWNNVVYFAPAIKALDDISDYQLDTMGGTTAHLNGGDKAAGNSQISVVFGGTSLDIVDGTQMPTYGFDSLVKFDADFLTPIKAPMTDEEIAAGDPPFQISINSDMDERGLSTLMDITTTDLFYVVKEDGSNWTSEDEMQEASLSSNNLRYYPYDSTVPEGKKIVGMLLCARTLDSAQLVTVPGDRTYDITVRHNLQIAEGKEGSVTDAVVTANVFKTIPIKYDSIKNYINETDSEGTFMVSPVNSSNHQYIFLDTGESDTFPLSNLENWRITPTYTKANFVDGAYQGGDHPAGIDAGDSLYIIDYKPQVRLVFEGNETTTEQPITAGDDRIYLFIYPDLISQDENVAPNTTTTVKLTLPDTVRFDQYFNQSGSSEAQTWFPYNKRSVSGNVITFESVPGAVPDGEHPIILSVKLADDVEIGDIGTINAAITTTEKNGETSVAESTESEVRIQVTRERNIAISKTALTSEIAGNGDMTYRIEFANNSSVTDESGIFMRDKLPLADAANGYSDQYSISEVKVVEVPTGKTFSDYAVSITSHEDGTGYTDATMGTDGVIDLSSAADTKIIQLKGDLPKSSHVTVEVTLTDTSNTAGTKFLNNAELERDEAGSTPLSDNAVVTISDNPAPTMIKEVVNAAGNSIDGQRVNENDTLTYKIGLTNPGTTARSFDITDSIPANSEYVEGSISDGGTYNETTKSVSWTGINLEAGTTTIRYVEFQVKTTSNAGDPGTYNVDNTAHVTYEGGEGDTNTVHNYFVISDTPEPYIEDPDPVISKKVLDHNGHDIDGDLVATGETIDYVVSVENRATRQKSLTVTDTIDVENLEIVSVNAALTPADDSVDIATTTSNGGVAGAVKVSLNIPASTTLKLTITAKVKETAKFKTITNTAHVVVGDEFNSNTNTVTIYTPEKTVTDLSGNDINGREVPVGSSLTYHIRIPELQRLLDKDHDLKIKDALPEFTKLVTIIDSDTGITGSLSDNTIIWKQGTSPSENAISAIANEVGFTVTATDGEKTLTNVASVDNDGRTVYTNSVTNTTPEAPTPIVVPDPVKSVHDLSGNDINGKAVALGNKISYRIHYQNPYSEAKTIVIEDKLPEHLTYVSGADNYTDGVLKWEFEAPANSNSYKDFVAQVKNDTGNGVSIDNTAKVKVGDGVAKDTNTVTIYTPVGPWEPIKSVELTSGDDAHGKLLATGTTIIYKIKYSNPEARNTVASIKDEMSEVLKYADIVEIGEGGTQNGSDILWNRTLSANQLDTVSVKMKIKSNAHDVTIDNVAKVSMYGDVKTSNKVTVRTPAPIVKNVYNTSNVDINGNTVEKLSTLLYRITVKNSDTTPANFVIKDIVPTNVSVQSVGNGGQYANGTITWNVTAVPAGSSTYVEFTAKAPNSVATIKNNATATTGIITQVSNTVTNQTKDNTTPATVKTVTVKESTSSGKPSSSSSKKTVVNVIEKSDPGHTKASSNDPKKATGYKTGDDTQLGLYIALICVAALAIFGAIRYKKKKDLEDGPDGNTETTNEKEE